MKPQGGTELLFNNLIKYNGVDWQNNVNLLLSICHPSLINPNKINVLWQHLYTDQNNTLGMNDINFINSIQNYVYVSKWQLNQFKEKFNINHCNNTVIKNAIPHLDYIKKPSDKIRLIYTSMPNRGLEILLDSFQLLDRNDVELIIYSSNIIYGKGYNDSVSSHYEKLFHRCKTMKNVIYKGYAMNTAVRKALQQSHILAYPSIFPETSCLAAIEAGAAGCKIVTTNYGALSETCDKWASYTDYTNDYNILVKNYTEILKHEIDNYNDTGYNIQSEWFNDNYSWENRKHEWNTFFNSL
jgi:glycosyltransferase involved in cell wall biosynthesis